MNKIMKYTICILCTLTTFAFSSSSEIIETNHLSDLIPYLTSDTLVILDIDNTVLEPAQSLGSDQWAWDRVKKLQSTMPEKEAFEKASYEWYQIHTITQVKTVEDSTTDLIRYLQSQMHELFALTTRRPFYAEVTLKELHSLDIDFSRTASSIKNCDFIGQNILIKEGIVFISLDNKKGDVVKKIFKNNNPLPRKIIFVDDKLNHVKDVAEACAQLDIDFVGLRYGAADSHVASFDRDIAETQHFFMNHILTDQEAILLKSFKGDRHE